ncbi:hypothetical protein ACIPRL_08155 [Streptomyces sp. NPDC090085]|uniref:hypothetical protein n=1 Tax=Streptomyces sp. NPDC090085 TaxID=3365943 RepID=UPI003809A283
MASRARWNVDPESMEVTPRRPEPAKPDRSAEASRMREAHSAQKAAGRIRRG